MKPKLNGNHGEGISVEKSQQKFSKTIEISETDVREIIHALKESLRIKVSPIADADERLFVWSAQQHHKNLQRRSESLINYLEVILETTKEKVPVDIIIDDEPYYPKGSHFTKPESP